jgi:hypothetical protein
MHTQLARALPMPNAAARPTAWRVLLCLLFAFALGGCADDGRWIKRADRMAKAFHEQVAEGQIEPLLQQVTPALREEAGDDALRAQFTRLSALGPMTAYERASVNVVRREGLVFVALSVKAEFRAHTAVEELAFVFKGKKTWISRMSIQVTPKPKASPAAPAPEAESESESESS